MDLAVRVLGPFVTSPAGYRLNVDPRRVNAILFERLLDDAAAAGDPVTESDANALVVSAIDGMAGIGKTALAVHIAYRVSHRRPRGRRGGRLTTDSGVAGSS